MNIKQKTLGRAALLGATMMAIACGTVEKPAEETSVQAIELAYMDSTVSPADDFFRFVNGKWLDKTEIPGDQGRWGSFNELREVNNEVVLNVLETASKSGKYEDGTDQKKAGDFYSIGMDSLLAESVGIQPLEPILEKIAAIENANDLQKYLSEQEIYGGGAFFGFAIFPDLKNSEGMSTYLAQGGLGLPDRDYYTKTDEKSVQTREKYITHVSRMLQLLGDEVESADAQAQRIMVLETRLAEASMTNVERRNIPALYNKMSLADLGKRNRNGIWKRSNQKSTLIKFNFFGIGY